MYLVEYNTTLTSMISGSFGLNQTTITHGYLNNNLNSNIHGNINDIPHTNVNPQY